MILRSATSVRIDYTDARAQSAGATRQARQVSRAQIKRVTLAWSQVSPAVATGVAAHFEEYGQRGRTFAYQPPPLLSHVEGQYAYDEPLTIDRTNPRNVSMRCVLIEAQASD